MRGNLAERRAVQQAQQGEHDRLLREAASPDATTGGHRRRIRIVVAARRCRRAPARRRSRRAATSSLAEIEALVKRPAEIAARARAARRNHRAIHDHARNQTADDLAAGETNLAEADKAARAAETLAGEAREARVRARGSATRR